MDEEQCIDIRQISDLLDWLLDFYTGKTKQERQAIMSYAIQLWPAVEAKLILAPSNISVREAFVVISEAIVSEIRAQQLDLAARSVFAAPKERILETRSLVTKDTTVEDVETKVARSASNVSALKDDIEVG